MAAAAISAISPMRVNDIYALCEKLMAAGVTINRPPRDGHMAFIRSPDGISIELLQDGDACRPRNPGLRCPTREAGEDMNFASDNAYGALPEVWAAIQAADRGTALAYGNDAVTQDLTARFTDAVRARGGGLSRLHRHGRQCAVAGLPDAALWRGAVPPGQPHHDVGMRRAGILIPAPS